jgi:hypothetical protein
MKEEIIIYVPDPGITNYESVSCGEEIVILNQGQECVKSTRNKFIKIN